MLRDLTLDEMEMVSGGEESYTTRQVLGSMYSKDAHNGHGGLYGPGGQLESAFNAFNAMTQSEYGVSGMTALSGTPQPPLDCQTAMNQAASILGGTGAMIAGAGTIAGNVPQAHAKVVGKVAQSVGAILGAGAGYLALNSNCP